MVVVVSATSFHPHPAFFPTFDYLGVTRSQDGDGWLCPLWALKMLFWNLGVTSRTLRPCFLQSMIKTREWFFWFYNIQRKRQLWWMMHLYSALLCIFVHPKRFTIMWGSLLNHHKCAASTWMIHRTKAPVRSTHTSYRWRVERVIEPIKWMGIIRRPWLTRASFGNLVRTSVLDPYSLRAVPEESGPLFNVSSERQSLLTVIVSLSLHWGVRTHKENTGEHPLLVSLTPLPAAT